MMGQVFREGAMHRGLSTLQTTCKSPLISTVPGVMEDKFTDIMSPLLLAAIRNFLGMFLNIRRNLKLN